MNSTYVPKERDNQIISTIEELTASHGYPPTFQEIADDMGLSSRGSIHAKMETLRALGLVTWEDGKTRTIRVVRDKMSE